MRKTAAAAGSPFGRSSRRRSRRKGWFDRRKSLLLEALSERKRLVGMLVFSGLSLFLILAAVLGEQGFFKVWHLSQQRSSLKERIAALELETDRLRHQVREWKAETAPYEKAARERLGLIRPGEVVYDFRIDPLEARR